MSFAKRKRYILLKLAEDIMSYNQMSVETTENQQTEVKLPNILTIAELVAATKISRQTISRKIKS